MSPWPIKRNDLSPAYTGQILVGGQALNLEGLTVRFLMRSTTTNALKVSREADVTDEANGRVSYSWVAGDTDTKDIYKVEWEITGAPDGPRTVPARGYLHIEVWDDLGP